MKRRLAILLAIALPALALAASDLDRIVTLPPLSTMTNAPLVPVQSPGSPNARAIPFAAAVRDVIASETNSGTIWEPACNDLTAICALATTSYGRGFLPLADAAAALAYLGAAPSGGAMVYPGAGIANSTGSAWDASYTTTGTGTVLALQTSPSLVTPILGAATGTSLNLTLGGAGAALGSNTLNVTNNAATGSAALLRLTGGGTGEASVDLYLGSGPRGGITANATSTDVRSASNATTHKLKLVRATGDFEFRDLSDDLLLDLDGTTNAATFLGAIVGANLSGTNTGDQTSVSGNAGTATALVANGGNCSAGSYPLGVDASGAVESCTVAAVDTDTTCLDAGVVCSFAGSATEGGAATSALTATNADNLTVDPTDCGANAFATSIDRQADLTCVTLTDADVPNSITITGPPTTNANLTGPITSVGNATNIASQTGTGTKFVMDTAPSLVLPDIGAAVGTSLQTTGGIAVVTGQKVAWNGLGAGWNANQNVFGELAWFNGATQYFKFGTTYLSPALSTTSAASLGRSGTEAWMSLWLRNAGASAFAAQLLAPTLAANIVLTTPAATGTLATLAGTEAFTNKTIDSSSIGATTPSTGKFSTLTRQAGSSTGYGSAVINLYSDSSPVGNVGGGTDDLISFSVPANTLSADGDFLRVNFAVKFAANANNKTFNLMFGGMSVYSIGAAAFNGTTVVGTATITWAVLATQQSFTHAAPTSTASPWASGDSADYAVGTENLATALTIKGQGLSGSSVTDDVRQLWMSVEYGSTP